MWPRVLPSHMPSACSAGCLVLLDLVVPMLGLLRWGPLPAHTVLHQPCSLSR